MNPLLVEGVTCTRVADAAESAVIVDARAYYRAFHRAAARARHYILLAGWQFDTDAVLLRGSDADGVTLPLSLLPLLSALCEKNPALRVHVLAWDFSLAYALEREWLQEWKFALSTPEAVRFEFDAHPRPTGSHHQKFVVIDGAIAFAGGMDLCDERWDDRDHASHNPLRVNSAGEACRPNHEVQAVVTGQAALALAEIFCERWHAACGQDIGRLEPEPEAPLRFTIEGLGRDGVLPLAAERVAISRTIPRADGTAEREILRAFEAAFAAAERLVYIETQYFTSRSIVKALIDRLRDTRRPKLDLVVVLPMSADSSKEGFALGETQSMVLGALEQVAHTSGHQVRFLCSAVDGSHASGATFIHSKVLVVDDRFLSVGSANMTERSMGFDSELSLIWEAAGGSALERDIGRVRASLMAEHANRSVDEVESAERLVERVDAWLGDSSSRLRVCHFEPCDANVIKTRFFDPGGPDSVVGDDVEPTAGPDLERFARGSGSMMRELSRRSSPGS
jgi:phospholipase D1/2